MRAGTQALRGVVATFVVGAALILAVLAVTLTHAPPRVVLVGAPGVRAVDVNGVRGLRITTGDPTVCQAGEVLPRGVSAIRLSTWGFFGARVRVAVYGGSRVLTEGRRGADWTSDSVTVPVKPLARTSTGTKLCFTLGPNSESILLLGALTPPREAATISESGVARGAPQLLEGRVTVEYLASGQGSWWSRILTVARHVGLGRSFSGTWIALLIAALTLAAGALAVRLTLRELPREPEDAR